MEHRKRRKRSYGLRLLLAMLVFSCTASFCVLARFVLTRSTTFGFTTTMDQNEFGSCAEDGLIWNGSEEEKDLDGTLGKDGYTLSYLLTGEDGSLLSSTPECMASEFMAGQIEHKTGYVDRNGVEIAITIPCDGREDTSVPMEVAIVADTHKKKILSYIDNQLVQVHVLEEGAVFTGNGIASLKAERTHSLRLYDRPLLQTELTQNYYVDLMTFGEYTDPELPAFLQKSSVLRVYSGFWEDQGRYQYLSERIDEIRVEDSEYQGLLVASASDASPSDARINYHADGDVPMVDAKRGYTVRYVMRMSDMGIAENLFQASGNAVLSGGFAEREFCYRAFGNSYSVDCSGDRGRISVVVTASDMGTQVYVNGEPRDSELRLEGLSEGNYESFDINMAGTGEQHGALYEVEVYDRILSPAEQNYLYQRDTEWYDLDSQSYMELLQLDLGDAPVHMGKWMRYSMDGDYPNYPDEEGYEFSHWFCEEYQTELLEEDFETLCETAILDGYHTLRIRPVYTAITCQIYLHHGDGTVMEEWAAYYGTKLPELPDMEESETGEPFIGWGFDDGLVADVRRMKITEDLFLYPVYEQPEETTAPVEVPAETEAALPETQPETLPETQPETQPETLPETQPESESEEHSELETENTGEETTGETASESEESSVELPTEAPQETTADDTTSSSTEEIL